jgi:non-ribosomal peptide synthetase component F/thioesterase domain-containing protein/acyl carrier protein
MKTIDKLLLELSDRNVKLWVEGDRLRYKAPKDALSKELLAEIKDSKSEIVAFLSDAVNSKGQLPPIQSVDRNDNLELSFAQQRLWLLHQFEPESSSNNMPVVVRLTGSLNFEVLERSISEVIRRHEILRTTFPNVDGQPRLVIAPADDFKLDAIDLRELPKDKRDEEALRMATQEARNPFDLGQGVLRVKLFRLKDEEYLLIWNVHCIICDGASSDVFYQDLTAIYRAFSKGEPSPLADLPIQYVDFAHWQRQWLQGEVLESQLKYWQEKLENLPPALELPTDRPRPLGVQTYKGDRAALMLPKNLNMALNNLSQKLGVTLFMTLLSAFEVLLYRYSGREDLLINFASAGRAQIETERLIGFFSNTLLLRANLAGNPTFRQLLNRVRESSLAAYAHQDLPFEKLIEGLPLEDRQARSSLFQIKFALNPPWSNGRGMASVQLPDLTFTSLFGYIYHGKTKYDLTLVMREQDEGLGAVFDYNADIFDSSTIARMLEHFQNLLEGIVANPDCLLNDLPLLSSQQQQLLKSWNNSTFTSDRNLDVIIHQLFEAEARKNPDSIALVEGDREITYQELNERADKLACYLNRRGVTTEVLVGIYLEKSIEAIVSILGILKAGGAYLAIDLNYSQQDRSFILEDSKVSILLTKQGLLDASAIKDRQVIYLDTDRAKIERETSPKLDPAIDDRQLACVIYTSSTQEFKGVEISHHNLSSSIASRLDYYSEPITSCLLNTSLSSSASIANIFWTLSSGGMLHIIPDSKQTDATYLVEAIERNRPSHLLCTPSLYTRILEEATAKQLNSLSTAIVSGETVSSYLAELHHTKLSNTSFFNEYGTTETINWSSVYKIESCFSQEVEDCRGEWSFARQGASIRRLPPNCLGAPCGFRGNLGIQSAAPTGVGKDVQIPIGRPVANTQIYILNSNLQPVPLGLPGEIYIGGDNLARSYFDRPELTTEKFISPISSLLPPASIELPSLCKTGDIGRFREDGNIEFLGRVDDRVIIRGFQVNLGAIENALLKHPSIREAAVIVRVNSACNPEILAYVAVKTKQSFDREEISDFLKQQLSNDLIPSDFVVLDSLPLNTRGKIDRLGLQSIAPSRSQSGKTAVSSRDELEHQLTKIWQKVLGIKQIAITDNFFDIGGNSLLAVRLFAEIDRELGKKLPLATLFEAPTIEELANILRQKGWSPSWSSLVTIKSGGSKSPLFCVHAIGGNVLSYRNLAKYLDDDRPVYGLQVRGLDGQQAPHTRIEDMAGDYVEEIRRIQPNGPYFLGGHSFGGLVAFEMAQQLTQQGETVDLLAMFDCTGPNLPSTMSVAKWLYAHSSNLAALEFKDKLKYFGFRMKVLVTASIPNFISQPYSRFADKFKSSQDLIHQKIEQVNKEALKQYQIKAYPGKVVLFQARVKQTKEYFDPNGGWGQLALGGVEIQDIPGDHSSFLFEEENLRIFAQKLNDSLNRVLDN